LTRGFETMTIQRAEAMIMRIWEIGESDLLVRFFTPNQGCLKGIAKAARRSRKRFANCLDLLSRVTMEYETRRASELSFLKGCKLIRGYAGIRSDYDRLSMASYLVELTDTLHPPGVVDPAAFDLLTARFEDLDQGKDPATVRIFFEGKAMALGGYGINLSRCCKCGRGYTGAGRAVFVPDRGGIACLRCEKESPRTPGLSPEGVKALHAIQTAPVHRQNTLPIGAPLLQEIKPVLKRHVAYRLGKTFKTTAFLA